LKALNNVNAHGKKRYFGDDVKCSNDLPTNQLYGTQYGWDDERNGLTRFLHCSLIKIQGCARSHRRATRNMDTNVNTVATSKTTFDASVWRLIGDKRRKRNATEHFVSQRVTTYRISLA